MKMKFIKYFSVAIALFLAGAHLTKAAEIHEAAASGDLASLSRIIAADKRAVRAKTATSITPLHYAAVRGNVEAARILITAGADITARTDDGKTPLQFVFDNPEMSDDARAALTDLLASGSDIVNSIDKIGLTPLHYAAVFGNASAASILIKRGALVNARDPKGNTPLHLVASCEKPQSALKTAEVLIAAGAFVNSKNNAGNTPLHSAETADFPNEPLVRLLIASGADLKAKNNLGQTPKLAAEAVGNYHLASITAEYERPAQKQASESRLLDKTIASGAANTAK